MVGISTLLLIIVLTIISQAMGIATVPAAM